MIFLKLGLYKESVMNDLKGADFLEKERTLGELCKKIGDNFRVGCERR